MSWQCIAKHLVIAVFQNENMPPLEKDSCNGNNILFCLQNKIINSTLDKWLIDASRSENTKSFKKAEEYRQCGNQAFATGNSCKAIEAYNKSLLYSFDPDKLSSYQADVNYKKSKIQMSVAYANRSAALFDLGRYEECLLDISRALKNGYPDYLMHKLIKRKKEAMAALKIANDEVLACDTSNNLEGCDQLKGNQKLPKCWSSVQFGTELQNDNIENKSLKSAIAGIECRFNQQKGRFLVATKSIKKGTTIITERPYASVLLPQWYETHCHHCYKRLDCLVPCKQCSIVRFCSDPCQESAWAKYHYLECKFFPALHDIGIAHLALRIILVTGLKSIQLFLNKLKSVNGTENTMLESFHDSNWTDSRIDNAMKSPSDECCPHLVPGFNARGEFGLDYNAIYSLLTHSSQAQDEDVFLYSVMATLLLKILEGGGFFDTGSSKSMLSDKERFSSCSKSDSTNAICEPAEQNHLEDFADSKTFRYTVGGLLYRHIQQLICNAHAITELDEDQGCELSPIITLSQERIATGIFLIASLMNHSCEPTIISSFHENCLHVKTTKDVIAGEEIFNCYGPHYQRMSKNERKLALRQQYYFECTCQHCSNEELHAWSAYKCSKCKGPVAQHFCLSCNKYVDLAKFEEDFKQSKVLYKRSCEHMSSENYDVCLEDMMECLKLQEGILYQYNTNLGDSYDCISKCYAKTKNYKLSIEYLEKSLRIVVFQFGDQSIEYANELLKCIDLICCYVLQVINKGVLKLVVTEARPYGQFGMNYISICKSIFQTHFESDHKVFDDLEEKEMFLEHFEKTFN